MILKKINAILSLVTTILLLTHAISVALWMLSQGSIVIHERFSVSFILIITVVLHALVSIALMILAHAGEKRQKGRAYPRMNLPTIVQRISGVLLILFTWLHIAGAMGFMTPPQVVHAIVPPLFFIIVMAHIAVSTSKAFITLGVGNAKFIKGVDISTKAICVITLVADIVGFYLYVC